VVTPPHARAGARPRRDVAPRLRRSRRRSGRPQGGNGCRRGCGCDAAAATQDSRGRAAAGSGALLTRADRVAWRARLHCCDYTEARRIINGLDQWQLIKGYADTPELILRAAIGP